MQTQMTQFKEELIIKKRQEKITKLVEDFIKYQLVENLVILTAEQYKERFKLIKEDAETVIEILKSIGY